MTMRPATCFLFFAMLAAAIGLVGCGKKSDTAAQNPPAGMPAGLHVMGVTLGRTIGPDKKILDATDVFTPTETIYASVETHGASDGAVLLARWTYEGDQLIDESTENLAPTGPATTEFHVSKPDGWPEGRYEVEIVLDGTSVATKAFTVKG
jgi:hypothetical protein